MKTCRIGQEVGSDAGQFPGNISINLAPWDELTFFPPGRFTIHPPTYPPIHPALMAGSSARCRGEYRMNE